MYEDCTRKLWNQLGEDDGTGTSARARPGLRLDTNEQTQPAANTLVTAYNLASQRKCSIQRLPNPAQRHGSRTICKHGRVP
jgi:hypothetical protein